MTTFDNREQAFENKFAHDEEMNFRITARRNRLLGQWAAEKMTLTAAETDSYSKSVVQAEFEELGDEDVVRKLLGDITAAGVHTDDNEVRDALARFDVEARRQLLEVKVMAMSGSDIEARIVAGIPDAVVELTDLAGDDNHWAARVTSAAFAGLPRIKQHQLVYAAIGQQMGGDLHALQLTTALPN